MLTSIVLPLFGLLSIYYTFYTLIQYIQNKFLLFLSTVLTIILQVVIIAQILPYNSQFNTKYLLFQYIYLLRQSFYTNYILQHIMLPPPFTLTTEKRQNRSLIQDVTPFLNNIIFQYTNPLPFETEPHTLHTIPLAREHCDSYFYYIRYETLEITSSQTPFQVILTQLQEQVLEYTTEPSIHKILHFLYKMFSAHTFKNLLNSMRTKIHHFIVLLT